MSQPNIPRIREWIEALESGDYDQGRYHLRDIEGRYCCLGVACDLSGVGEWKEEGGVLLYQTFMHVMPDPVMRYYGFDSRYDGGDIEVILEDGETTLSNLNDSGYKFAEIAQILRKHFQIHDPA